MLERIKELISEYGTEERFFKRINLYFPQGSEGYKLIVNAYAETMRDFCNIKRDGGSPYFGHPEAVAIIVLEHLRIRDPHIIAAAILHDNVEDLSHLKWSCDRISQSYNQRISELVWWVTKPLVSDFSGNKDERDRVYHVRLSNAPREAIIIKLPDRLHNILTLWAFDKDKQKRKIQETKSFYLSLAEKHTLLIHELEAAMEEVEHSWQVSL